MPVTLQRNQMKGRETIVKGSIFTPQTIAIISTFFAQQARTALPVDMFRAHIEIQKKF